MRFARRSRPSASSTPFVTQSELRDRLNEDATALSGALLLNARQSGFLDWLERQVDALQATRVDAETLQAIIQRWQQLRAAATLSDTGVADLIAVDY
jgi:hypothetical protein